MKALNQNEFCISCHRLLCFLNASIAANLIRSVLKVRIFVLNVSYCHLESSYVQEGSPVKVNVCIPLVGIKQIWAVVGCIVDAVWVDIIYSVNAKCLE